MGCCSAACTLSVIRFPSKLAFDERTERLEFDLFQLATLHLLRSANQEFLIRIGLRKTFEQRLHRTLGIVPVREDPTNRPDERRFLLVEQQVFATRTRRDRIDGREDTTIS